MGKRYVMGNRPDGLSDILIEDEFNLSDEKPYKELWLNTETPADMSAPGDPVADQQMIHEPPEGGALLRVLSMPPESSRRLPTPEQMVEYHVNVLHSANVPTLEYLRKARHISMHKTDTLSYSIIIEGEMWALSEGRDVLLKPGDVLIKKGCMHGWRNDSDKRCVWVAILIDGIPIK